MLSHTKFQDVDKIINLCIQWRTSDIGQIYLQEQVTESTWKTFAILFSNSDKKEQKDKMKLK